MRTTGRKKYGIFIATIILIGLCAPSFAQPTMEEMLTRMEQMEAHIKELQSRLSKYEQSDQEQRIQVSTIENKLAVMENKIESDVPASDIGTSISGIDISGGTTMVYQFTNRANGNGLSQNSEDVGDASYSIDLEFSKKNRFGACLHAPRNRGRSRC